MKKAFKDFIVSERGDTKFMAIIIITVIVTMLAFMYWYLVENGWDGVRTQFHYFLKYVLHIG
ncbi:hypothetical protein [Butyrivibrio sp. AE2032]|uniref:hypothetical protein n=1 Tax=Butyrivibrio sp. AE2032 TaxID=1458463 RepID=UPI00054E62DD|nr:hypothetical protein [Butyrivibrio sp. AE2032]